MRNIHAEVTLETGLGDITFIPAYRETDSTSWFYGPAFNTAVFDEAYERWSAELRLAGDAAMFDYIVGGFYFHEDIAGNNEFNQEFVLPIQEFTGGTESWAAFGQLTANLTDQFRLVGGLRYTEVRKSIDGQIVNFITFCGANSPPPVTPPASFGQGCAVPGNLPRYPNFLDPQDAFDWLVTNGFIAPTSVYNPTAPGQRYLLLSGAGAILKSVSAPTDSGTFDKVTWKLGVEFDAAPDNLLYASIETGYRAGGFQLAIAENGMLLTQGYANSSIRSPTRTGLLTGCYQYRFPVGLEEPLGPWAPPGIGVPLDRRTIAQVLRERGYETALVGKWHLGHPPEHSPLRHGYDHFFGIIEGGADYFRHRAVINGQDIGPLLTENERDIERVGYLTDLFGDEAVQRIGQKRKPLFLSLHFTAPHWPWEGREDEEIARQIKDFYHYDGGSLKTYARMIEAMDDNVGKVLAALRETGELDNSIIVFTSDNGGERFSDVWPFIGMKGELLEGGIRVPILWQWPTGSPRGVTSEQVMISMDFLPTFLAIAGGSASADEFDGMDLSSQLTNGAPPLERTLFWRMKAHEQAAARSGDWKFLKLGDKQHLFDLAADQHERANLAERNPDKLRELRLAWDAWNAAMLPYPLGSFSQDNREKMIDRY